MGIYKEPASHPLHLQVTRLFVCSVATAVQLQPMLTWSRLDCRMEESESLICKSLISEQKLTRVQVRTWVLQVCILPVVTSAFYPWTLH